MKLGFKQPFVSIIILAHNSLKFLPKCLTSILNANYSNFEVILVDNASTDGSLEYVRKNFSYDPRLKIISNKANLGFAEGNNVGVKLAKGEYLFFLNVDTIVDPNWLNELIKVMRDYPFVGICQSKLLSLKNPKLFDSAGDFIDKYGVTMRRGGDLLEKDEGQYDKIEEIFSSRGAALMTRREVINEIGLFDPAYFITYEDVDFCWRARLHGYRVLYVPTSIVYHVGEASSPASIKVFYTTKNGIMTLIKNYELHNLFKILPQLIVISLSAAMAEVVIRKKPRQAIDRLRGILWNLLHFKYIWKKRLKVQYCIRRLKDAEIMQYMLKRNLAISHFLPLWRKTSAIINSNNHRI